ncbi:MAG: hypothetical protein PHV13_06205 [Candidatus ainarchaeum sp.]|nr:hypothetical protein [Candidatus ainarchaeum sp.]
MEDDFSRVFKYAADFYLRRLGLIVLFSIPFVFAFLIPVLVAAPTYLALGGVFLRTGSMPELSLADLIITALGYAIAVFLIADTIVNVNIIVRSKRTLTEVTQDILGAMGTHAMRIFYIYTLMLLVMFIIQLLLYDNPLQSWLYPLFLLVLSYLLFFVPPAVVIDHSDTPTAIRRSAQMALQKPRFFIMWTLMAFFSLSLLKVVADFLFSGVFAGYFVLLVDSLIILPFLIVLQTQMYMEKYPLAR